MKATKLKPIQMMTITASAILGLRILSVHRELAMIAQQDAWISVFLAGLVSIILGMPVYVLARLYPDRDLPEIVVSLGGKLLGRILLIPLIVYTLGFCGLSMRMFSEATKLFILDATPTVVISVLSIIVVASIAKRGIYAIGGVVDLIFVPTVIIIMFIIIASYLEFDWNNIRPVLFENTSATIRAVLPAYKIFIAGGVFAYVLCYTAEPEKTLPWFLAGLIIPILIYTSLSLAVILVFGPNEVEVLTYPGLTLSKAIDFPVTLLERLESILIIAWIPAVLTTTLLLYFSSVRNVVTLLGVGDKYEKHVVYAHIPLVIGISMLAEDSITNRFYMEMIGLVGVTLATIFVPLLTGFALVKKRRNNKS